MIWENIEEALGDDSRNSILAAEAFQYFCKISPDIFFNPVAPKQLLFENEMTKNKIVQWHVSTAFRYEWEFCCAEDESRDDLHEYILKKYIF